MSFQATAARSSRYKSAKKQSAASALGLRRTSSAPSAASPRKKDMPSEMSSYDDDEQLDDIGIIASLADDLNFRDVPQYMEYIRNRMFSEIPEKGAGMNSTRIAEILNYRRSLPPIVTIAHIDALSTSPTKIEREIAELSQAAILRRVTIPRRGVGAASVGDGIASVQEWDRLVRSHSDLEPDVKSNYMSVLTSNPTSSTIPSTTFTATELSALVGAGFLTTTTTPDSRSSLFASPGAGSLASLSTAGSRHAAGSLDAVGGLSATQHIHGGTPLSRNRSPLSTSYYNFSLPNTGRHLKLLLDARNHLLNLLRKSKFKESPVDVLRERWDGGIATGTEANEKKRARGEFSGVLPGRTKKWKQFYGLRFEWVLEECTGAGLVELFETGSVGRAVRIVG